MKTLFATLVLVCLAHVGAAERAPVDREQEHPRKLLQAYLTQDGSLGGVFRQGKLDGVDYRSLLRGAIRKNARSLRSIFHYTAYGRLMGEGAESNADILRQLLRLWGDDAFARVLRAEDNLVRWHVIGAIEYASPGRWKPSEFTITYRLAAHDGGW